MHVEKFMKLVEKTEPWAFSVGGGAIKRDTLRWGTLPTMEQAVMSLYLVEEALNGECSKGKMQALALNALSHALRAWLYALRGVYHRMELEWDQAARLLKDLPDYPQL